MARVWPTQLAHLSHAGLVCLERLEFGQHSVRQVEVIFMVPAAKTNPVGQKQLLPEGHTHFL